MLEKVREWCPPGATTTARRKELMNLSKEEKYLKKMYWVGTDGMGKSAVCVETIKYRNPDTQNEYDLNLAWQGEMFENYWHAYAYWLRSKS